MWTATKRLYSASLQFDRPLIQNIQLKPSDLTFYEKNGFVVLRKALNEQQLQQWGMIIDEAVNERDSVFPDGKPSPQRGGAYSKRMDTSNAEDMAFVRKIFVQRMNLFQTNKNVYKLLMNIAPYIGRIVHELEYGLYDKKTVIRLWHEQALYKEPYSNPTAFHNDNPYWGFHSLHACTMYMALDDIHLKNGCMYFLPESQKIVAAKGSSGFKFLDLGKSMDSVLDYHPELRTIEAIPCELKAGDCTFHNGLNVHCAGPNITPFLRRAMTFQFMPECDGYWNGTQQILSDEQVKDMQIGDKLDHEDRHPLLYDPYNIA
eukprot:5794_1